MAFQFGQSPTEVMLEEKLKQVTAERDYLLNKLQGPLLPGARPYEKQMDLPGRAPLDIRLPKAAAVIAEVGQFQTRVMARTHPRSGENLGIHYYADTRELESVRNQANLLGYLHEHFIRQLADFLNR